MCSQLVWRLVHWCAVSSWQGVYQQDWLGKIQRKYKIFRRTKIWQKKHLMKPSLKAIVAILESSIVKTDDVTSGRRDMDPHGRLRAVQGRMGQWKILRHSRALTVQKWSQKFDACAELLLLLLFVIKKKSALSENEGTKWGHNFTSSTRDATSIFCGHQSLAKGVPLSFSCCIALRVLAQSRGSNLPPPALKWKVFLAVAVVVTWSPYLSGHHRIILMKGPFWIRIGCVPSGLMTNVCYSLFAFSLSTLLRTTYPKFMKTFQCHPPTEKLS